MRVLAQAEHNHFAMSGKYASIEEMISGKELDANWVTKELDGYHFDLRAGSDSSEVSAIPTRYPANGHRSFYVTSANWNVIHAEDRRGRDATEGDPVLGEYRQQPTN